MAEPVKFWVLTSEGPSDTCDTMALWGFYSTVEKAREYLAKWVIGDELAEEVEWTQSEATPDFWQGHSPEHDRCYLLTRHSINEVDYGV